MFKAFARVAARSIAIQLEEAAAAARSKQPYVDPTPKIHQYNAASKGKIADSNLKPLEKPIVVVPISKAKAEDEDAVVLPIRAAPEVTPEVFDDLASGADSVSASAPPARKMPQQNKVSPSDSLISAQEPSRPNNETIPQPEPIATKEPTPEPAPEVESAIPSTNQPAEPDNLAENVDPEDVSEE
jgi:hypothetical protein